MVRQDSDDPGNRALIRPKRPIPVELVTTHQLRVHMQPHKFVPQTAHVTWNGQWSHPPLLDHSAGRAAHASPFNWPQWYKALKRTKVPLSRRAVYFTLAGRKLMLGKHKAKDRPHLHKCSRCMHEITQRAEEHKFATCPTIRGCVWGTMSALCLNHKIRFGHKDPGGTWQLVQHAGCPLVDPIGGHQQVAAAHGDQNALRVFGAGTVTRASKDSERVWMVVHSEAIRLLHDIIWVDMHPNKVPHRPLWNGPAFQSRLSSAIKARCIVQHQSIAMARARWQRRHGHEPGTQLAMARMEEIEHMECDFEQWVAHGFVRPHVAHRRSRIKWHEVTVDLEAHGQPVNTVGSPTGNPAPSP